MIRQEDVDVDCQVIVDRVGLQENVDGDCRDDVERVCQQQVEGEKDVDGLTESGRLL